jgi:hypothetical protein
VSIKTEETKILWDYYATKEHEGLERFQTALSKSEHYDKNIAIKSPDLDQLSSLIEDTNRKLQMPFKREHNYSLQPFEEQLYKEVMFDARPTNLIQEEYRLFNKHKKVTSNTLIRNLDTFHKEAKRDIPFPNHK